jgi:hypothetical protein
MTVREFVGSQVVVFAGIVASNEKPSPPGEGF